MVEALAHRTSVCPHGGIFGAHICPSVNFFILFLFDALAIWYKTKPKKLESSEFKMLAHYFFYLGKRP